MPKLVMCMKVIFTLAKKLNLTLANLIRNEDIVLVFDRFFYIRKTSM